MAKERLWVGKINRSSGFCIIEAKITAENGRKGVYAELCKKKDIVN